MYIHIREYILFLIVIRNVLSDGNYECGEHGRFEYCIDEIPGCVVGCHCHPGYYFDTDTKICEPNQKLIEHHRRHNFLKPERIQPPAILDHDTVSTVNTMDAQVDEMKKEADDLGDWLYNQFFKTIENQVVNSTKKKEIRAPTRRSEINPIQTQNEKKRLRKKAKRMKKKKNLRIDENDSIFDDASSDSDTSSSDTSTSTDSDSDEHGHKKIVIVQRKPQRVLPSFIFLPNMDTPFYPPLGLPPPPVMPMYPVVPVPPVLPVFPVPVPTTTSITAATQEETTITTEPTVSVPSPSPSSSSPSSSIAPKDPVRSGKKRKINSQKIKDLPRTSLSSRSRNELKKMARQKFIKQLQARNKGLSSKLFPPMNNLPVNPIDELSEAETPMRDASLTETLPGSIDKIDEASPQTDNVDFKYMSELIHKVDINKSNNYDNKIYPIDNFESNKFSRKSNPRFVNYLLGHDVRSYVPIHPNSQIEDSYYSNIGRQIASLIRNIDTEKKATGFQAETNNEDRNLYFKENSPTTFWERYIRSPQIVFNSNKNKFESLKRSNELLFDLENEIEIIASTPKSLNLQEIENIVKSIERAKNKIGKQDKQIMLSNTPTVKKNLDVDLWPQKHQSNFYKLLATTQKDNFKQNKNVNIKTSPKDHNQERHNIDRLQMENINKITIWHKNVGNARDMQIRNSPENLKRNKNTSNRSFKTGIQNEDSSKTELRLFPFLSNPPEQFLQRPGNILTNSFNKGLNRYNAANNDPSVLKVSRYRPGNNIDHQPTYSYFRNEINHFDFMN